MGYILDTVSLSLSLSLLCVCVCVCIDGGWVWVCMYDGVCVCACVCVRFLCVRMCVRVYMGVLFEFECKYLSVKNKQEKKAK